MRYWLLTTEYPPQYGGGIGTYCYFMAKMLSERGHNVTVFMPDKNVSDHHIESSTPVTLICFGTNRKKLSQTLGYTARLSYEFAAIVREMIGRNGKPDYIEAQDYLGIAYYLQQFKWTGCSELQNIPIAITLHSPAFLYLEYNRVDTYKIPNYWTCEMEKQTIIAADCVVSPSHFLPEALRKYIRFSKQVHIIPYPYSDAGIERKLVFKRNKIVFYGKLSPQKGIFELLTYFKELWDEGHAYCLELVGGTDIVYHPEGETMGKLVRDRYIKYISDGLLKITGKIAPAQMDEKLGDAHVVIVPSTVENLPYAVIETMSRGRIVLASMQGGQREIIRHEVDGFLFDHQRKGDFKKQLLKILALSDADVAAYGDKAVERIRARYNFERIYARKLDVIQKYCTDTSSKSHYPFLYQEPFQPITEPDDALLTVVIPCYNLGAYLAECITSVLKASYKPLQILIVNDGSTDEKTLAVLNDLAKHDRITVMHKKNEGLASARNDGAQQVRGRYLAFLDADDKVAPDYYEKAVYVLNRYENVFFAGAWAQYFENSHNVWPAFPPQPPYALAHNPVNSSALVYKTVAFMSAGRNDRALEYGLEDYESVISMLSSGYNGTVLPETLFHYRVRSGSMIRRTNKNKLLYAHKYIAEKHAAYYSKFAAQLVNLLNSNGPGYIFDNPTMARKGLIERRLIAPAYERLKDYINANPKLKSWIVSKLNNSK